MNKENDDIHKIEDQDSAEKIEFQGQVYHKHRLPPRLRYLLEKYLGSTNDSSANGSWSSDWSDWGDHSDTGRSIVSNVLHKTLQDVLPGRNPSMYPTTTPVVCDHDVD